MRKSHKMVTAAYLQKKLTAGMTVMEPNAKARKLVTLVMVMLRPARSTANLQRASMQGLTIVHFSVQRERFLWDRGCI